MTRANEDESGLGRRAADLLTDLIAIPSVNPAYDDASPGEHDVAEALAEHCERIGMEVTLVDALPGRPNVVARLRAREPRRALLFEVHTDTVGLPRGQRVAKACHDGDRLYGRGACDVKGGLAAVLLALEQLALETDELGADIVLLGAVDEEYQYRGVLHYLRHSPDVTAAIVVEPTELRVITRHSGVVRMRITVAGRAAHSSRPEEGRNAIMDAYRSVSALYRWNTERAAQVQGRFPRPPTLSVNQIWGGQAVNIVPDLCSFDVDIRTLPSDDPDMIYDEIENVLRGLQEEGIDATVAEDSLRSVGLDTSPNELVVRSALAACASERSDASPGHVTFGSDASKLARIGGIPSVVLGPGSIRQAHSDDEWVAIMDLVTASRIYAGAARNFGAAP